MKRSVVMRGLTAACAITVLLAGTMRGGQSATPDVVRVGRSVNTAFAFAALEVGVDAGIWDKLNMKVEISSFKGDGQLQQAFTANQVDFGLGSGPSMGYRAKGVPAIAVASMYGPPSDMGIVVGDQGTIKSLKDFKGKTLAVTTAGSLTDWLVHELSRQQGWGPDGITSLPMGSTEARVSALRTGQIAGSVQDTGVGYELEMKHEGKLFSNFGPIVSKFETHVIFATDNMVNNHPDEVQRFLKGWFQTVAYMRSHKAETVKIISGVLQEDPAVVARLYDADMGDMSKDGSWDAAAVEATAKSLKALGIMDTVPDPKTLYTTKFTPVKV